MRVLRAEEFAARLAGEPYRAGGIRATVEATRAVSTFRWASETIRHGDDEVMRLDTEASHPEFKYKMSYRRMMEVWAALEQGQMVLAESRVRAAWEDAGMNQEREQIVDRNVVVVANLKARAIRGVESRGMLLAAGRGGKELWLVDPGPLPPGTEVK